eukprot:11091679-Lingulodinium_polyedra.AAC.1
MREGRDIARLEGGGVGAPEPAGSWRLAEAGAGLAIGDGIPGGEPTVHEGTRGLYRVGDEVLAVTYVDDAELDTWKARLQGVDTDA